jgi:hypothetical protein
VRDQLAIVKDREGIVVFSPNSDAGVTTLDGRLPKSAPYG